jgi:hypothetical protein
MKKLTQTEITALLWQDLARAYQERAEQLLRATAEPETHLEPVPDRWLTAQEVARALRASPGHVYANADKYPFTRREGRLVRFSAQGVQAYLMRIQNGARDAPP